MSTNSNLINKNNDEVDDKINEKFIEKYNSLDKTFVSRKSNNSFVSFKKKRDKININDLKNQPDLKDDSKVKL